MVMTTPLSALLQRARPDGLTRVVVHAPGRLHLGFLDPGASLGRAFGSLGLVIDTFETVVELSPADEDRTTVADGADPAQADKAGQYLHTLRQHSRCNDCLRLHLAQTLPAHAGLGSGTQLALAVGSAFARLHGFDIGAERLAQWLGRGLRSAIGVAGFEVGGMLLDGGPGPDGRIGPLLCRLEFPTAWRVVLALDGHDAGLAGNAEAEALAHLPPFARDAAADLCHHVLMQILPGIAASDFESFARGVTHVQRLLGSHFAPAQGGTPHASRRIGRVMNWMASNPGVATGQSSWGPTGFAFVETAADARDLVGRALASGLVEPGIELRIVGGRNVGASVTEHVVRRTWTGAT
jgi:beta-ribofuranosylaminobenzene 5'-phosphate synthase